MNWTKTHKESPPLPLQEKEEISPKSVDYDVQFPKFLRSLSSNWPIIGEATRFMNSQLIEFQNR